MNWWVRCNRKVCTALNVIKHLLISASVINESVLILFLLLQSEFFTSFALGNKMSSITAEIRISHSLIERKTRLQQKTSTFHQKFLKI